MKRSPNVALVRWMARRAAAFTLATALPLYAISASAAPAPNHLKEVRVEETRDGAQEIVVVGTQGSTYSARLEGGGKRLLVDLAGTDTAKAIEAVTPKTGVVGGVMATTFGEGDARSTRLTIHLRDKVTYRIRPDGATLRIALSPAAETNAAPGSAQAKTGSDDGQLSHVKFDRGSGRSPERILVSVSGSPTYAVTQLPDKRLRLEIRKTRVPESEKRTMDVASLKGTVKSISIFDDPSASAAIVEVSRDGDSQGSVSIEDGKLVWAFDAPTGTVGKGVRRTVTVAREEAPADVPKIETSIRPEIYVETEKGVQAGFTQGVAGQVGGENRRFAGRRIDLDLKDADIHNILRLLADVGRVNIVTADDVQGNITIRMRNVPWDQALDVVLQAKGLGMVRQGNLIRVAPMFTLQKERELKLTQQKQELELAPLETRLIPVSYASADELQARAKDFLSPRGSLAVDTRTNVLIARDVAGNLNHIEELVRSLDTQTPQVLVEARIVEATSRYLRDVGIQWGGDATFSEATGNPTGVAFPSRAGISGGNYDNLTPTAGLSPFQRNIPNPNFAVNLPATVGTGQGGALGLSFGSIDNNFNLGVRLSAAEASGMLRIVSSPRILTLDNRDARISQGTLIPFSQVSAQGVQTTFQEAKLQLLVKPHVTADGSVAMHVRINRDEPDFNQTSARGDPTILKREAETDLLVMDGHTAVIGGIFTRNTGRNLDQVPFFGDIPILGVLFQRRRASDSRNELVIFLTPRIVNRAEALGR
ncbi:MAG: type IV pilus secretin PilQ [Myxococcales bacterium]|nr:type IV pilus secretin PilQ [Myxococcales bacterium]